MVDLRNFEAWFVTGSQHLYGSEALDQVKAHSLQIARAISESNHTAVKVKLQPVMTTSESIRELCLKANSAPNCIGLICWMHTFSPAKMWIHGLRVLNKPFAHLHTQFNRELPWSTIDMEFMNLNQSAHGDREFGFIASRMRLNRKVIAGFWQDEEVQRELGIWMRAACAWHDAQTLKVARFGDNMLNVAVTEGDKVEAQMRLGYSVHGYGVGDLAERLKAVTDAEIESLAKDYDDHYAVAKPLRKGGDRRSALREAARIEAGLRNFLSE